MYTPEAAKDAIEKAIELGSKDPANYGINWAWANSFPSKKAAEQFVAWLNDNGYEHRGVYIDDNSFGSASVRYRKR